MHSLTRIAFVAALACAAALSLPLAQARELDPIDALDNEPLAMQPKAAALPVNVQQLSREERLDLPTFVQLRPSTQAKAAPGHPADAARAQLKALAPCTGSPRRRWMPHRCTMCKPCPTAPAWCG